MIWRRLEHIMLGLSLLLTVVGSGAVALMIPDVPSVPTSYGSHVTYVSDPGSPIPISGDLLYSYPLQSQLLWLNETDGLPQLHIHYYNLNLAVTVLCNDTACNTGTCKTQNTTEPMMLSRLPPGATFQQNQTRDGQTVEEWSLTEDVRAMYIWSILTNSFDTDKNMSLDQMTVMLGRYPYGVTTNYIFTDVVRQNDPFTPDDFAPPDFCHISLPTFTELPVFGYVLDAASYQPLPFANLSISPGGGQRHRVQADFNGRYNFVARVNQDANVTLLDPHFAPTTFFIPVGVAPIPSNTLADLAVSTSLQSTSFRIVVTWTEFPADLDSILDTPSGCQVNYTNRACGANDAAQLARDETAGYGPETITVDARAQKGLYAHSVRVENGDRFDGAAAIARLYIGNRMAAMLPANPDKDQEADVWNTFAVEFTADGTLDYHVINSFTTSSNTLSIEQS
ncbi:uncharacterized protein MONBRDRAFT_22156 [Monosiga brevicollis MX1]|uniref:Uncharacterized protein n=1 Tax=Monosiga brevicollis TaxID=81824 RepID=A9UPQ7_MONBE|nr:uncharacterized protein MONBRDRAFT_22156 [Monosiga brevicollis MX1]EDQ92912.1 predicted protein [Monosiga brevicollis MX1]|eukprot:XP_001742674.1 hypothetical protein [Monosiga brevicollis MX1]